MVYTCPYVDAKHRSHLPRLGCAAMSTEPHFSYLRPRHAQYTDRSEHFFVKKTRMVAVCPNVVMRVALADDSDPFTDLGMGEEGSRMRGSWNNGKWVGEESIFPVADRKVAEGRILGYNIWQRHWPKDLTAANRAKACFGHVWPEDNLLKRIDRLLYSLMDTFWEKVSPDPSEDSAHIAKFIQMGALEYSKYTKRIIDMLDKTTGFIFCFAAAVDPTFQRRGIGARMMRWGMERAEKEGVPILLTATRKGSALYDKLGFETLGIMALDVEEGLTEKAMIYWPKDSARTEAHIAEVTSGDDARNEEARVLSIAR